MQSSLNKFISEHPIFDESKYSKGFRMSMVRTLQGLGLPTPIYGKKAPFGYKKEGRAFVPIESELHIFHTAITMFETGDYMLDDVIDWFNAAASPRTLSPRAFKYAKADRPTFPEITFPIEQRIALLNGRSTSTSPEESILQPSQGESETYSEGNGQAEDSSGAEEAPQGDGTPEGA